MALTAERRKQLPPSDFAGPGDTYPDDTKGRARDALSRVSQNGSPALKTRVRKAVSKKYPAIKVSGIGKKTMRTGKS